MAFLKLSSLSMSFLYLHRQSLQIHEFTFGNTFSVMFFLSSFFCHAFSVMLFLSRFFWHAFVKCFLSLSKSSSLTANLCMFLSLFICVELNFVSLGCYVYKNNGIHELLCRYVFLYIFRKRNEKISMTFIIYMS